MLLRLLLLMQVLLQMLLVELELELELKLVLLLTPQMLPPLTPPLEYLAHCGWNGGRRRRWQRRWKDGEDWRLARDGGWAGGRVGRVGAGHVGQAARRRRGYGAQANRRLRNGRRDGWRRWRRRRWWRLRVGEVENGACLRSGRVGGAGGAGLPPGAHLRHETQNCGEHVGNEWGGGQLDGSLYLRGHPPEQEGTDGWNHLDPTRVKRWEVAIVPGGRESGSQTTWLKTKLRLVRGEEGRVLAGSGAPPPNKEEL